MIRPFLSGLKQKFKKRGLVLMYHRIGDADADPWDLAVSVTNFEEHLGVLLSYNVISLDELNLIVNNKKKMLSKTVALTFDDGYRDNYLNARPLLDQYNLPACFFIATGLTDTKLEFWWDALERICLQTHKLPNQLKLNVPHKQTWKISGPNQTGEGCIDRLELYFALCDIIRKLPASDQCDMVRQLEIWSSNNQSRPGYMVMNLDEVKAMASNLFTVGAHTVTHPYLPNFDYAYQKTEIFNNMGFLKSATSNEIKYIAYPHGGRDEHTVAILGELNYKLGFTTDESCFMDTTHQYSIPRFQVKNWNGETFAHKLKSWLN